MSLSIRQYLVRAGAMLAVALAARVNADVTLTQTPVVEFYTPGGTLDITVSIDVTTAGQINAIGVEELLPAGWTYASLVGGTAPSIVPNAGDSGAIDFAWFPLPVSYPVSFTFRVNIAADATGTSKLNGTASVLFDGVGQVDASAQTTIPKQGTGPFHSADTDLSGTLSLSEMLRLIQFYNTGGFHCADFPTDTEDGYVPGILGAKACNPHNSDYNPQDWRISLSELLRAIQFYNVLGYYSCPGDGTEDGWCPGPQP